MAGGNDQLSIESAAVRSSVGGVESELFHVYMSVYMPCGYLPGAIFHPQHMTALPRRSLHSPQNMRNTGFKHLRLIALL